jgi:hypothetical protein
MAAKGPGEKTAGGGPADVDAIRAEAAAVFGSDGRQAQSWGVSRVKAAVYGVACPLAILFAVAFVAASGSLTSDAADPAQREFEEKALALVLVVVFGGIGLLAVREFLVLALFGGGLAATPEGLRFAWGRRTMLFRWDDVNHVAVEARASGRGEYDVLVIRFGLDYRWPRAFSLWFSKPACLCISPLILADPVEVVAKELGAAAEQHAADRDEGGPRTHGASTPHGRPLVYAREIRASEKRPRWIAGTLIGVALVLWAVFCAWGVIEAVGVSDLGLVLGRGLMGLVTGAIGLALLLKGDAIRKAWDEAQRSGQRGEAPADAGRPLRGGDRGPGRNEGRNVPGRAQRRRQAHSWGVSRVKAAVWSRRAGVILGRRGPASTAGDGGIEVIACRWR